MTKERVLKVLKENLEWQNYTDGNDSWDTELKEAVTEAIKLIEQQPSEDCVSREDVGFMLMAGRLIGEDADKYIQPLLQELKDLPPVTPAQCIAAVRFSKNDLCIV